MIKRRSADAFGALPLAGPILLPDVTGVAADEFGADLRVPLSFSRRDLLPGRHRRRNLLRYPDEPRSSKYALLLLFPSAAHPAMARIHSSHERSLTNPSLDWPATHLLQSSISASTSRRTTTALVTGIIITRRWRHFERGAGSALAGSARLYVWAVSGSAVSWHRPVEWPPLGTGVRAYMSSFRRFVFASAVDDGLTADPFSRSVLTVVEGA